MLEAAVSTEAHRLGELEEACGQLLQVTEIEGFAVAVFAWGAVSLPGELAARLRGLQGKRIGILRIEGRYRVKER